MTRYTVYLRQPPRGGWEWSRTPDAVSWWGIYATQGQAKGAAKRSLSKVVGGKSNPDDFEFIMSENHDRPRQPQP